MAGHIKTYEELRLSPKSNVEYIIDPGLLTTGGIMLLAGDPGAGKSWMAQQVGFELACGKKVLGLFPAMRCKVAYFELEKRNTIAQERFDNDEWAAAYPELGNPNSPKYAPNMLGYYNEPISIDTDSGYKWLYETIENYGPKVAIIDSYSVTLGNELELKEQKTAIKSYRKLANELQIGLILVCHINKVQKVASKEGTWNKAPLSIDDLRGSKILVYEVDTVIGVNGLGKKKDIHFLKHSFCKYNLDEQSPYKMKFDAGTPMPFKINEPSMIYEVLDILNHSPNESCSLKQIEDIVDISRPTLIKIADKLELSGIAVLSTKSGTGSTLTLKKKKNPLTEMFILTDEAGDGDDSGT